MAFTNLHQDFRADLSHYIADEARGELIPDRLVRDAVDRALSFSRDRHYRSKSEHLLDDMTAPKLWKEQILPWCLEQMTEAERDERTMSKLGRLYGSSV